MVRVFRAGLRRRPALEWGLIIGTVAASSQAAVGLWEMFLR